MSSLGVGSSDLPITQNSWRGETHSAAQRLNRICFLLKHSSNASTYLVSFLCPSTEDVRDVYTVILPIGWQSAICKIHYGGENVQHTRRKRARKVLIVNRMERLIYAEINKRPIAILPPIT